MTELITLPRALVRQALEALELAYAGTPAITVHGKAITALKAALEQPKPPPEAQTEAEKIAYCAGWWAAMEQKREQQEPEQEPVVWGVDWGSHGDRSCCTIIKQHTDGTREVVAVEYAPSYTHPTPPRREWRGLTEEEIQSVIQLEREKRFQRRPPLPLSMTELSHAIEAALKEKNHE